MFSFFLLFSLASASALGSFFEQQEALLATELADKRVDALARKMAAAPAANETKERAYSLPAADEELRAQTPNILVVLTLNGAVKPSFLLASARAALASITANHSLEFIIVQDQGDCLPQEVFERVLPAHHLNRIRYACMQSARRLSAGTMRNMAAEMAQAPYIALWDINGFFAPERLSLQLQTLKLLDMDVCTLYYSYVLDVSMRHAKHALLFKLHDAPSTDPAFETLMFKRSLIDLGFAFPNSSYAQDFAFVQRVVAGGARFGAAMVDWAYVRDGSSMRNFRVKDLEKKLKPVTKKKECPAFLADYEVGKLEKSINAQIQTTRATVYAVKTAAHDAAHRRVVLNRFAAREQLDQQKKTTTTTKATKEQEQAPSSRKRQMVTTTTTMTTTAAATTTMYAYGGYYY